MLALDPLRLARRQLELDRVRTRRYPHLLRHKAERMVASPLALLRGSAPLFYEVLEKHPILAAGPPGEGWIVGDCHLENFGAFRTGALSVKETRASATRDEIAFDLNDFDDALVAPWRLDVLRLMTSLVLSGRELGTDGAQTLGLCEGLLDAYVAGLFRRTRTPPRPEVVATLVEKVRLRSRVELLEARTEMVGRSRRFERGGRYEDLPPKLRVRAERAFAKYVKRLPDAVRPDAETVEVLDAAFRIAGTGSLGCLRIAFLVRGRGGPDGSWVFDMKEEGDPSAACFAASSRVTAADRVMAGLSSCLATPPRMIGTSKLRSSSMFVRRLAPQEDRLDLGHLATRDLEPLSRHLGALLGAAHRRGATRTPKKPWRAEHREGLLARAIALAGMHEAMYLAYCQLVRG